MDLVSLRLFSKLPVKESAIVRRPDQMAKQDELYMSSQSLEKISPRILSKPWNIEHWVERISK